MNQQKMNTAPDELETVSGIVDSIIYQKEENFWWILFLLAFRQCQKCIKITCRLYDTVAERA